MNRAALAGGLTAEPPSFLEFRVSSFEFRVSSYGLKQLCSAGREWPTGGRGLFHPLLLDRGEGRGEESIPPYFRGPNTLQRNQPESPKTAHAITRPDWNAEYCDWGEK